MNIKQARKNVIEQQIRPWGGLNVRANQALIDVPRENFVPEGYQNLVFADIEIPLDSDQKMLSPKIEGRILDSLDIIGHESALEIGTGSGYFTSVLARLCKSVKSIEVSKELSELAEDKIKALKFTNVSIVTGDALTYNFDNERFDIVVVGCALPIISRNKLKNPKIMCRNKPTKPFTVFFSKSCVILSFLLTISLILFPSGFKIVFDTK